MSSWTLGIDFGTTFTVAAVAQGGDQQLVDVESDGSCRMPSAVLLDEAGDFAVGRSAIHQSLFYPDRYEPTPKRMVGEGDLLLGDALVPVADVIAAVVDRVGAEGRRVAGGTNPARTVLTHPADWGATRLDVLRKAAEAADLGHAELVPEPVAAAVEIGTTNLKPGEHVAVYDFGGGTFDVAVLRRTANGFEVAGPPGGRDPLGGEDIDGRIINHLGAGPIGEHPDWHNLLDPPDVQWRRHAAALRAEVCKAKEGLSNQKVWQLWIPGIEREIQLIRDDLDQLILADVGTTVEIMVDTVHAAGIELEDLAGIYLVGGSSRIPLVAAEVWRLANIKPSVQGDPKTVVALGATAWRSQPSGPVDPPSDRTFTSNLAMATRTLFWNGGAYCYGYLTVTPEGDGGSVEFSEEPAVGDLVHVAEAAAERHSDSAGYQELSVEDIEWLGEKGIERRFVTDDPPGRQWVERYVVSGARSVIGLAPVEHAARLDALTRQRPSLDPERFYQLPFSCKIADGDVVHERLELIRVGTNQRVTAESHELDPEWADERVATFSSHPGYTKLGQTATRLLGQSNRTWALGITDGVPGQMHSFWVATDPTRPRQTRIWIGQAGGRLFSVVATLPENEKLNFRFLLSHVTLVRPEGMMNNPAPGIGNASGPQNR